MAGRRQVGHGTMLDVQNHDESEAMPWNEEAEEQAEDVSGGLLEHLKVSAPVFM